MTPKMLRGIAAFAWLLALGLAVIWLLELLGVVELLDNPIVGAIAFAAVALACQFLARKGDPSARR